MTAPGSSSGDLTPPPRWPTTAEWRSGATYVLVTRAAFLVVAWAAAWLLSAEHGHLAIGLSNWRVWDADIYAKIAQFGYSGPGAEPWSEAFPPSWPLLVRAVHAVGLGLTPSALLLTTLASIVAVTFLIRLVDEEDDHAAGAADPGVGQTSPSTGRRAALYLLVFPTAVFLVAGYAEALFLAGAIPAFREARRGRWARVGPFAAVAVGARWAGLFLLIGLAVELVSQRPRGRTLGWGIGALAIGTLPALLYAGWLQAVRGDLLFFLVAQREGWHRGFVGPVEAFKTTWDTWNGDYSADILLTWRLEILAAAIGVALVAVLLRRREWGYAAYVGSAMAVMMTSSWYYSIPRILLTMFPLVILLARWTGRGPDRHSAVLAAGAAVAALGVVTFTRGAWFF